MSAGVLQLADLRLPEVGAVVRLDAVTGPWVGVIVDIAWDDEAGAEVLIRWGSRGEGLYPVAALEGVAWTVSD